MMRRKHLLLVSMILGVLFLSAAAYWLSRPRHLAPDEAALVGTWLCQPQPGGPCTVLLLNPDRTCRIRWLDSAGNEEQARSPLPGRWGIQGGRLVVAAFHGVRWSGLLGSLARDLGIEERGGAWAFGIEGGRLVFGPGSDSPVNLRRSVDVSPRKPE